ncbi:methyltransferase domain-containing protein [Streptomyces sp. NBC_00513]|uniref:methyltransferase domain-containing protein n=1 Tax=unclassified Streptomyces TaxID=2593676 RepID=UPI00224FE80E|nr:methyltransferase domain-containing protein [Streptomyces sp. NBC_00424]MCX5079093.1 methyltransferase domain-containing protein [Streptomyces sp. NBC_00424]WUD39341.1 methyltransferase domain-containing protein [Streptomyces sp. NBC_00513]
MASAPHLALDSDAFGAVDGRHIRALAFQSVRVEYLDHVIGESNIVPSAGRALVVGSGRGLLARGLARLGFEVTAADASHAATVLALEADDGPGVTYLTAPAEELDLPDSSFDLVYCADTLEITERPDAVLAEAARVLRPGGAFVYDTVNRTLVSRLIYLGAFQAFPGTRIMPRGRYAAQRLRTPVEIARALGRAGLTARDVSAFKPRDVRSLVRAIRGRRSGTLTDEQLPDSVDMVLDPGGSPLVTYLGYGVRR